jgi:hypothetical protein
MHTAQAEVGVYKESIMPSALGWRRSASEAAYLSPHPCHYGRGVSLKFSPLFYGGYMEEQEKLKRELHSCSLGLLRQGFSLQAVVHAMIVESQRLSDSANVVEAIEESKFKP